MATLDKPVEVPQVACEVCLREVPATEAIVAEAVDYVVNFCGLECYGIWKRRSEVGEPPAGKPDS